MHLSAISQRSETSFAFNISISKKSLWRRWDNMNYIEIVKARLMVMAFAILSLAAIGWAFVMHLILGSSSTGLTVSYTLICIFASSFVCSFSSGVLGASTIGR